MTTQKSVPIIKNTLPTGFTDCHKQQTVEFESAHEDAFGSAIHQPFQGALLSSKVF